MTAANVEALQAFQWARQPAAESLIRGIVDRFIPRLPFAADLAQRMRDTTGTRFVDWIDSITLSETTIPATEWEANGFEHDSTDGDVAIYRNPHGVFPVICLLPRGDIDIALKVDSVADFLATHQLDAAIEGEPFAHMRRARVATGDAVSLSVVERRGTWTHTPPAADPSLRILAAQHLERFRTRRRHFTSDKEGFDHANTLADAAVRDLGTDQTCALFFAAEREFWQRKNRAAQVQKHQQDLLGLGWGNHDHHTYRSSRENFTDLIAFFEKLGLQCRERFYAGKEAGWGAQVMENPRAGIITFNDVDLSPDELLEDFSHHPLPHRNHLGTIGLWCGLHGEAFLNAGMHHLECQFDFDKLAERLKDHNITIMKPFTNFPYLRQAFTEGERWPVAEDRIQRLLALDLITPAQAETFRTQGAIGSHLENLERNEGFKGFNQKGVSEIINATDPRNQTPT